MSYYLEVRKHESNIARLSKIRHKAQQQSRRDSRKTNDEEKDFTLTGTCCIIYRNNSLAEKLEKLLAPLPSYPDVQVDRFDVRSMMDVIPIHETDPSNSDVDNTDSYSKSLLNFERYRSILKASRKGLDEKRHLKLIKTNRHEAIIKAKLKLNHQLKKREESIELKRIEEVEKKTDERQRRFEKKKAEKDAEPFLYYGPQDGDEHENWAKDSSSASEPLAPLKKEAGPTQAFLAAREVSTTVVEDDDEANYSESYSDIGTAEESMSDAFSRRFNPIDSFAMAEYGVGYKLGSSSEEWGRFQGMAAETGTGITGASEETRARLLAVSMVPPGLCGLEPDGMDKTIWASRYSQLLLLDKDEFVLDKARRERQTSSRRGRFNDFNLYAFQKRRSRALMALGGGNHQSSSFPRGAGGLGGLSRGGDDGRLPAGASFITSFEICSSGCTGSGKKGAAELANEALTVEAMEGLFRGEFPRVAQRLHKQKQRERDRERRGHDSSRGGPDHQRGRDVDRSRRESKGDGMDRGNGSSSGSDSDGESDFDSDSDQDSASSSGSGAGEDNRYNRSGRHPSATLDDRDRSRDDPGGRPQSGGRSAGGSAGGGRAEEGSDSEGKKVIGGVRRGRSRSRSSEKSWSSGSSSAGSSGRGNRSRGSRNRGTGRGRSSDRDDSRESRRRRKSRSDSRDRSGDRRDWDRDRRGGRSDRGRHEDGYRDGNRDMGSERGSFRGSDRGSEKDQNSEKRDVKKDSRRDGQRGRERSSRSRSRSGHRSRSRSASRGGWGGRGANRHRSRSRSASRGGRSGRGTRHRSRSRSDGRDGRDGSRGTNSHRSRSRSDSRGDRGGHRKRGRDGRSPDRRRVSQPHIPAQQESAKRSSHERPHSSGGSTSRSGDSTAGHASKQSDGAASSRPTAGGAGAVSGAVSAAVLTPAERLRLKMRKALAQQVLDDKNLFSRR